MGRVVLQRVILGVVVLMLAPAVLVLAYRVSSPEPGPVVISEMMSSNGATLADEDGDHGDWLELHNPTDAPVDLGGYHLTDDEDDPLRWRLPARSLEPDGFLLVWASGKDRAEPSGELHTDFRISQEGEPVLLTAPDGERVVDRFSPVALPRDVSFGRDPDDPGQLCFFAEPTPGSVNSGDCLPASAFDPPTLSAPSGFYDDPFALTMSVTDPEETILYTLDGSYPDPEGNPQQTHSYEDPIRIEDRSTDPDRLTATTTAIDQRTPPPGPVQKGTVVRARTEHSDEAVGTYFVGPDLPRPDLPVISLAADEEHLFDHETGIYVPGAVYEEWLTGSDFDPERPQRWRPANYGERGRAWERPAEDELQRNVVFTYCDPGGSCDFTTNVGMRIHGHASRSYPQKSLRLYARAAYGARTFDHPFFGGDASSLHRRLILRNSGNDWRSTMLIDGYLHGLASHFTVDTQAYRPTVVYLNGEYWGIHNLRERYDRHYLEITHGVDPDAVVIVSSAHEVSTGRTEDAQPFLDLLAFMGSTDPTDTATLAELTRQLDLENFIDYLVLQLFTANEDWPVGNADYWRERVEPGNRPDGPADGRWRWLTYDLDAAGGFAIDPEYDSLARLADMEREDQPEFGMGIPLLFNRLVENESFRHRFLSRFADHLNTAFDPDRTVPRLDELEQLLEPEMARHIERWPVPEWLRGPEHPDSVEEWRQEVDRLRDFVRDRPAHQREQIVEFFRLTGTAELRILTDEEQGFVTVNTVDLVDDTPGVVDPSDWTGTYFRGVPVTLAATPLPGYRFVGWEGVGEEQASHRTLQVLPDDSLQVEARFAPD